MPNCLMAQQKYKFTCDSFDKTGLCTYKNLSGSIALEYDADDLPVLLIEVRNPTGKGAMLFGYWTDPETTYGIKYIDTHEFDDSLRKVIYITDGDEDEFMLGIRYNDITPQYIIMSYRFRDKSPIYIHIPYSMDTYDRICGIIRMARNKIGFRQM